MKAAYLSLDGRIVAYDDAVIHVSSVAMKYGASVFEGVRAYWNAERRRLYLLALDAHLDRLFESLRLMDMTLAFSRDDIHRHIDALIDRLRLQDDGYLRIAASITADAGIDATGPVLLNIAAFPQGRKASTGVRVGVSAWRRLPEAAMPPRIKCVANYQNGRLAMLSARAAGYDNALLLDDRGKVSEAPTSAFFAVRRGVLCTPPLTSDVLESITRRLVLEFARAAGIPVAERVIDRSECYLAEEAFLCGTGAEILPICSIDQHTLGDGRPGPITSQLQQRYFDVAYGRDPAFERYITPCPREARS